MAAAAINEDYSEMDEFEGAERDFTESEIKVETKEDGSAVSESGSTESKTESEGLLTIDETAQAQEQEGKLTQTSSY